MEYKGKTDLIRYHSRAIADPETRFEDTAFTTASNELNAGTSVAYCSLGSTESASAIQGQQRKIEHLRKQSQWKDLIVEKKVLESNLLALRLKKKDLELSNVQQFVDDLESVTDAAELNEVYYTRRHSPTPGLQSGDPATAPSITEVSPLLCPISVPDNDNAEEHRLKISEASCAHNSVVVDYSLTTSQVPAVCRPNGKHAADTNLHEPVKSRALEFEHTSYIQCSTSNQYLPNSADSLTTQSSDRLDPHRRPTRGPADFTVEHVNINNRNDVQTLDYSFYQQPTIGTHIVDAVHTMRRELPNLNNPPIADTNGYINQQHGNPRPVCNRDPSETRMYNSFLNCRQDNLISPSADKDVMRYTVGIRDSNPLASDVCPGARLTSTDVSLPSHVYLSYTVVPAGPEHSSVPFDKVDPVYHAKDLTVTMANTYVPTNYFTDVLACSTRYSAARAHIDLALC